MCCNEVIPFFNLNNLHFNSIRIIFALMRVRSFKNIYEETEDYVSISCGYIL